MEITNEFEVKAPIEGAWTYLLDVERIAPCMPGAELTEVVDERTWKGRVAVKLGPVSMSFAGTVVIEERDDAAHRVKLRADGREQRGKGAASAVVDGHLEPTDDGTKVSIVTDLTITGAAAQYGRGMIQDISARLTKQFADCLGEHMVAAGAVAEAEAEGAAAPAGEAPPRVAPAPAVAKPVKGIRLALWALWRAIVRAIRRLFGRSTD